MKSEKNQYRQSYLQSIKRDTDIDNKCIDTKGERGKWDELGDGDRQYIHYMYSVNVTF